MKLRNKITKEICDAEAREDGIYIKNNWGNGEEWHKYGLGCLGDNWEYYVEPKEPLIKDEKIRKAVRAWAEANNITQVSHDARWNAFRCTDFVIAFDYYFDRHDGFEDMKSYTIDELCGEEEE